MRIVGDGGEDRMRARLAHAGPSDLRHLERTAVDRAWKARDASGDDAETIGAVLFTAVEEHLDSDTDAQEGLAGTRDIVAQHGSEAEGVEVLHSSAGSADPRQDHAVSGADTLGTIGDFASMAEVFARPRDARGIPGVVIDDGYNLRLPVETSIAGVVVTGQT